MGNFNRGDRSDRGSDRGSQGGRGGSSYGNRGGGSRGGFGGGRGGFGGGSRGGYGGQSEDRQMFQATCAECGNACDVPFRPNGNKPVYCRDCFAQINAGPDGRRDDRGDRGDRGSRRPPTRNFDRDRSNDVSGRSAEHIDQQFAQLNEKLDKILRRLTPSYARPAASTDAESVDVEIGDEAVADDTSSDNDTTESQS